jgi:DNA-binding NarL/FixJ family response regulator
MDTRALPSISKVFLVDDAQPVRRRIAQLLATIHGVAVVGEAEDAQTALDGILACHADIAVVDLRLAGGSGIELIAALSRARSAIVKIVLTNHSGPAFRSACANAGADFFFDKTTEFDAACRAIAAISRARESRAAETTRS